MIERDRIGFGNTVVDYSVVRSQRRRKTIEITLDPSDGVVVSAPIATPPERIRQIVARRAGWIVRRASAEIPHRRPKAFVSGESLPYLGRQVRLIVEHADVRWPSVAFKYWRFHVVAPAGLTGEEQRSAIERAFVAWYRRRASEGLLPRVQRWAILAGAAPTAVVIRDQRQRWASCGADGVL